MSCGVFKTWLWSCCNKIEQKDTVQVAHAAFASQHYMCLWDCNLMCAAQSVAVLDMLLYICCCFISAAAYICCFIS
jgi:hypothetical protein